MASLLFAVSPADPITFAGVPALLALTALLASYRSGATSNARRSHGRLAA